MKKTNRGFTLIELLVVIAIIAILAAIIVPSISNSRKKSRDVKRLADLRTVQSALELYADKNGNYVPLTSADTRMSFSDLTALTTGGFISVLPADPTNQTNSYKYCALNNSDLSANTDVAINAQKYMIYALLEDGANKPSAAYATTTAVCPTLWAGLGCGETTAYCVHN